MILIPQMPLNEPPCPWAGLDGGPAHPAHELQVTLADQVSAAMPSEEDMVDMETMQLAEKARMAASARPGMRLYQAEITAARPQAYAYTAFYLRCPVCGFVLPVTRETRPGYHPPRPPS